MNQDAATVSGPDVVRLERRLPGPIERVWSFITESELRGTWLAGGPMDPRLGGRFELHYDHSLITDEPVPERYRAFVAGHREAGQITAWDPPRVIGFTWGEVRGVLSHVTIELSPAGDDVHLVLTHRRLPPDGLAEAAAGWHAHLDALSARLGDRVEGRPVNFWTSVERLTAQYRQAFPVA